MEAHIEPPEAIATAPEDESPKASLLPELANRYLALKVRCSDLEGELEDVKKERTAAEAALIDLMVNELEMAGMKTSDGVGISAGRMTAWNCPAEHKDALYAKLREDGHDRMFSINVKTLQGFTKDMAERNNGTLDEAYMPFFEPFETVKLNVRDIKKWSGGGHDARPDD